MPTSSAASSTTTSSCIALLGGSFDPVHNGHVALGEYFVKVLAADSLRIIPTGNPWQKPGLQASAHDRVAMTALAFEPMAVPVKIDQQEIQRHTASYTIDTVKAIRAELGREVSLAFLIGADQLQHLDSWHNWQDLFNYVHLCAASRPGFALDDAHIPDAVQREFANRAGTSEQIRQSASGLAYLAQDLALNISATEIRAAIARGERPVTLAPSGVLDYIEQHHLYKN